MRRALVAAGALCAAALIALVCVSPSAQRRTELQGAGRYMALEAVPTWEERWNPLDVMTSSGGMLGATTTAVPKSVQVCIAVED
jgi:hypothetical protein